MTTITMEDFERVDIRVGTVLAAERSATRKLAYLLSVDFGPRIGIKKTITQLTKLYEPSDLVGHQILGVVNLPPRQIGPVMSEFRLLGFELGDKGTVIAVPERVVANGDKLT